MNLTSFFTKITGSLFYGSLPLWQKNPVERLVKEGLRRNRTIQEIAYVLATGYHETMRWKKVTEIGKGEHYKYGELIYLTNKEQVSYYARGDCGLTWLDNYAKASVYLSVEFGEPINLVSNPDLAIEPKYSSLIIWEGMIRGMFTGINFQDCKNSKGSLNYLEARRIINGNNQMARIADYAQKFEEALRLVMND